MTSRALVQWPAAFVVLAATLALPGPTPATAAPAVAPATRVYYFHGTNRCNTCRTIEAYAHGTIARVFAAELKGQKLEWQAVNVDEAANRHYVDNFQLYTRSLVVFDARNPKRYKVLEKVWELVGDKPAFEKYVEQEVRAFMRS